MSADDKINEAMGMLEDMLAEDSEFQSYNEPEEEGISSPTLFHIDANRRPKEKTVC